MEMPLLHQNTADRSLRDGVSRMGTALQNQRCPGAGSAGPVSGLAQAVSDCFPWKLSGFEKSAERLFFAARISTERGRRDISDPWWFWFGRHLIRMFQSFNDCYTSLATCFRKEGFEPPTHHVVLTARNTLRSGTAAPRRLLCGKPLTCETARLAVPYRIAMA